MDRAPWTLDHFKLAVLPSHFVFQLQGTRFQKAHGIGLTFRDELCLEGQDYQGRQIRMYPVEARHTGHNNAVTDAALVLNVLAGRFDRWPRL